jgi:hypothetical protein
MCVDQCENVSWCVWRRVVIWCYEGGTQTAGQKRQAMYVNLILRRVLATVVTADKK